jgi:hypothetical protein
MPRQLAEPHLNRNFPDPLRARITGPSDPQHGVLKETLRTALQNLKMDGGPTMPPLIQGSQPDDR